MIKVSFQSIESPTPFSIIPFTIIMNHFAGIILLINCKGNGMLESGKINPESIITGSINPINEIIKAVCCVSEMVEIKTPNVSEMIMNNILSKPSRNKFPSTGMLKIKMLKTTITTALINDKNM